MKKQYPVLAVGVISVSFAAIFIRLADASPLVIAAMRLGMAALMIVPVALVRRKDELRSLSRRDLMMAVAAGAFLALHFGFWIASLSYTSIATSVILVTANPVFVALASYLLFKEKLQKRAGLGILISIAGAIVIGITNWNLGADPFLGATFAALGALTIAGYLLIGRKLRRNISLLTYTSLTYGSAAVFLVATALLAGFSLTGFNSETWLMFLLLALVPQLLGHSSINWALKYVPATMVTIAVLGEPVVTALLAFLFLREAPTLTEAVGGILILGGIFIAFRNGD